jgi:hypothetical protein
LLAMAKCPEFLNDGYCSIYVETAQSVYADGRFKSIWRNAHMHRENAPSRLADRRARRIFDRECVQICGRNVHRSSTYAQKIRDLADLRVARAASVKGSWYHARASWISMPVCGTALWGGTLAGEISLRREFISAWQHAVKIFTGFRWLPCGSYCKAVIAGSSVRKRTVPALPVGLF